MKKKIEFSNFGFSTILLCFVMICVVTFSALSLVSAYSDYKLSKKVAEKNQDYYKAQETAYEKLAAIDNLAVKAYGDTSDANGYYNSLRDALASYGTVTDGIDGFYLSFTETIAEDHFLHVTLNICYPENGSDSFVKVIEWKSYYEKPEPEDDILDLIQ
jgi:hypothetical protein